MHITVEAQVGEEPIGKLSVKHIKNGEYEARLATYTGNDVKVKTVTLIKLSHMKDWEIINLALKKLVGSNGQQHPRNVQSNSKFHHRRQKHGRR